MICDVADDPTGVAGKKPKCLSDKAEWLPYIRDTAKRGTSGLLESENCALFPPALHE
jgi:hypothetical protein